MVKALSRQYTTSLTRIWLHIFVWVGFSILLPITIVVSGLVQIGYHDISNPLDTIDDFFSTDARQLAMANGFTCQDFDYAANLADFCISLHRHPIYIGKYLDISGGVTKEVDLRIEKDTLTLGDLILFWGKPEIYEFCGTLAISWNIHHITATIALPLARRNDYYASIENISFVRVALPHWEEAFILRCEEYGY